MLSVYFLMLDSIFKDFVIFEFESLVKEFDQRQLHALIILMAYGGM